MADEDEGKRGSELRTRREGVLRSGCESAPYIARSSVCDDVPDTSSRRYLLNDRPIPRNPSPRRCDVSPTCHSRPRMHEASGPTSATASLPAACWDTTRVRARSDPYEPALPRDAWQGRPRGQTCGRLTRISLLACLRSSACRVPYTVYRILHSSSLAVRTGTYRRSTHDIDAASVWVVHRINKTGNSMA